MYSYAQMDVDEIIEMLVNTVIALGFGLANRNQGIGELVWQVESMLDYLVSTFSFSRRMDLAPRTTNNLRLLHKAYADQCNPQSRHVFMPSYVYDQVDYTTLTYDVSLFLPRQIDTLRSLIHLRVLHTEQY